MQCPACNAENVIPARRCASCGRALTGVEVGVDQTIDQPVEAGDRVETEEVLLDATYASLEVGPQDLQRVPPRSVSHRVVCCSTGIGS